VDVDGDMSKLTYLVWLDGNEATPEITTGTALTMPTARYSTNGVFTPGPRKIYVRAIDDGGRAGPADSAQWNVRSAVTGTNARLLIVDDCPRTNASNLRFDTLYSNSAGRIGLLASEYSILRLDVTQPFRTPKDVEQTFDLFQSVVWYRANEVVFSTLLDMAEPGIAGYLDHATPMVPCPRTSCARISAAGACAARSRSRRRSPTRPSGSATPERACSCRM
jgi:hypothetical protein